MNTYNFELVLAEADLTDSDCNRLYEAGADDATIVTREGITRLAFDREADSLEQAIRTASADTRAAGFTIARIEMDAPAPSQRAG